LSDRKSRDSSNTGQIGAYVLDAVATVFLQFKDARPALTVEPDVLTFILANGTVPGWRVACPVLDSTGSANVAVGHVSLSLDKVYFGVIDELYG
jgi:hypothetical protein